MGNVENILRNMVNDRVHKARQFDVMRRAKVTGLCSKGHQCDVRVVGPDGKEGPVMLDVPLLSSGPGEVRHPAVGDEVVLAYIGGDPNSPVVVASLLSKTDDVPDHSHKEYVTSYPAPRSGVERRRILFEGNGDGEGLEVRVGKDDHVIIERSKFTLTKGKTTITIDKDGEVEIKVEKDVQLEVKGEVKVKANGLSVETDKDLSLRAIGKLVLSGKGGVEMSSDSNVKVKGSRIDLN